MNEQIKKEIFQVRDTGQTNMYDVKAVRRIAFEMNCYALPFILKSQAKNICNSFQRAVQRRKQQSQQYSEVEESLVIQNVYITCLCTGQ